MYEALHFAPPIENFGKVWIVAGFKIFVSTCCMNNLMPFSKFLDIEHAVDVWI